MYMKKFLIFIITLLLVACGDSDPRQKDKDKVIELLAKQDNFKTLGFTFREIECLIDEVSTNMDDDMWEKYVESVKLISAGFTESEILERLNFNKTQEVQYGAAIYNAILSFKCMSEDRLIEIESNG